MTAARIAWIVLIACASLAACTGAADTESTMSQTMPIPPETPGPDELGPFRLTSTAFAEGGTIPRRFTCDGEDVSPPLRWDAQPDGTQSLALVVVDPDAPKPGGFVHWVLAGMDPPSGGIAEGSHEYTAGTNDFGNSGWGGPCPPSGTHRYVFTIYAFDHASDFAGSPTREAVEAEPGRLGTAVLTATYSRTG